MKTPTGFLRGLRTVLYILACVNLAGAIAITFTLLSAIASLSASEFLLQSFGAIGSLVIGPVMSLLTWLAVGIGLFSLSISILLAAAGRMAVLQADLFIRQEHIEDLLKNSATDREETTGFIRVQTEAV